MTNIAGGPVEAHEMSGMTEFSRADIEAMVREGVRAAFRDVGFNEQEAFEHRRDMEFLRDWRKLCELSRSRGILMILTMIITGLVGMLVLGFRGYFSG